MLLLSLSAFVILVLVRRPMGQGNKITLRSTLRLVVLAPTTIGLAFCVALVLGLTAANRNAFADGPAAFGITSVNSTAVKQTSHLAGTAACFEALAAE